MGTRRIGSGAALHAGGRRHRRLDWSRELRPMEASNSPRACDSIHARGALGNGAPARRRAAGRARTTAAGRDQARPPMWAVTAPCRRGARRVRARRAWAECRGRSLAWAANVLQPGDAAAWNATLPKAPFAALQRPRFVCEGGALASSHPARVVARCAPTSPARAQRRRRRRAAFTAIARSGDSPPPTSPNDAGRRVRGARDLDAAADRLFGRCESLSPEAAPTRARVTLTLHRVALTCHRVEQN
jgi:hypothetical protein